MRNKLLLVLAIMVATSIFVWLDYSHSNPFHPSTSAEVQTTPDFSFTTVDKQTAHQLSDFNGKVVLINFWASWCVPCIEEYPALVTLAAEHPDDLVLIMLSSDQKASVAYEFSTKISQEFNPEYSGTSLFAGQPNIYVAWDERKAITRGQFGITRYPESIVLGTDGKMAEKIVGMITDEQLQTIRQLVKRGQP